MQQQSYSQVAKAEPAWAAPLLRSIFMSRHLSKALNKEEPAPSRAEEACHQAIMFRGVLLPTSLWGESLPVFFLNASLANPVKEFFTAYFIKQLPAPCPSLWPTHTTPQITQLGKRRRPFSLSFLHSFFPHQLNVFTGQDASRNKWLCSGMPRAVFTCTAEVQ